VTLNWTNRWFEGIEVKLLSAAQRGKVAAAGPASEGPGDPFEIAVACKGPNQKGAKPQHGTDEPRSPR
jgi:hypothetical protein